MKKIELFSVFGLYTTANIPAGSDIHSKISRWIDEGYLVALHGPQNRGGLARVITRDPSQSGWVPEMLLPYQYETNI